jgi:hypothetical protein
MWEILKAFNLGHGDDITCYRPGQSVPDEEFSAEMAEGKLLLNGWVAKREEDVPIPLPEEPPIKKFKRKVPEPSEYLM